MDISQSADSCFAVQEASSATVETWSSPQTLSAPSTTTELRNPEDARLHRLLLLLLHPHSLLGTMRFRLRNPLLKLRTLHHAVSEALEVLDSEPPLSNQLYEKGARRNQRDSEPLTFPWRPWRRDQPLAHSDSEVQLQLQTQFLAQIPIINVSVDSATLGSPVRSEKRTRLHLENLRRFQLRKLLR